MGWAEDAPYAVGFYKSDSRCITRPCEPCTGCEKTEKNENEKKPDN